MTILSVLLSLLLVICIVIITRLRVAENELKQEINTLYRLNKYLKQRINEIRRGN